ncbi:helix-turn-helix domain-containing protein [Amycolatopsis sp. lyj-108]|uniref:helix-turn-helix domain-containing protein n=1 Tax=Amycolatopsis sp. lyj-108 TaxID=2789286 RepID=UPI003979700E
MTQRFADILQGLMNNRKLSPRTVSRASARAESTILQLLNGAIPPSPETLRDIAPVLNISEADLLVIAGLTTGHSSSAAKPYHNSEEIGKLVSIASSLSSEQLRRLIAVGRNLKH